MSTDNAPKHTYEGTDNIHNWQQVLSDPQSPYRGRTWEYCKPFVALCLRFAPEGRWVDLGCGHGLFVECCARFGIHCEGLEADPNAQAIVEARYPGLSINTADLREPLPFSDGSVAVTFCDQVLEHLPPETTHPFLTEVRRILKPGGLLFVNMPSVHNRAQRREPSHINLMTPSQLVDALVRAGFERVWPALYPRFFFGTSKVGKLLAGAVYGLFPIGQLTSNASALAFALGTGAPPEVKGPRFFHLQKLLTW